MEGRTTPLPEYIKLYSGLLIVLKFYFKHKKTVDMISFFRMSIFIPPYLNSEDIMSRPLMAGRVVYFELSHFLRSRAYL